MFEIYTRSLELAYVVPETNGKPVVSLADSLTLGASIFFAFNLIFL